MRVDPVPSVPSESVPALRTHLPLGARFTRLDQTVILFNQPERGVLNQLGWRNTFDIGDLRQPAFLLRSELHFHT